MIELAFSSNLPVEGPARWYAIRVKPHFESVSSRELHAKGYEEFLPLYRARRFWSDRVKESAFPLFPGYIFCRFILRDRYVVLNTTGVLYVLSAGKDPVPVNPGEIESIQVMCNSGMLLEPWPHLETGARVVVERGPLAGTAGVIVRIKGQYRLVVSLSILQRSITAEVERDWIRPISGRYERPAAAFASPT